MKVIFSTLNSFSISLEEGIYNFDSQHLIVIPSTVHYEIINENQNLKTISIQEDELNSFFMEFPRHANSDVFLENKLIEMQLSVFQTENVVSFMKNKPINQFLLLIKHYFNLSNTQEKHSNHYDVVQLNALIDEYYPNEIKASFYASKMGMSTSKLNNISIEGNGKKLIDVISKRLINDAKLNLANTELKIRDISNKLAFRNTAHFSTWFKRLENCSPSTYRKVKSNSNPNIL